MSERAPIHVPDVLIGFSSHKAEPHSISEQGIQILSSLNNHLLCMNCVIDELFDISILPFARMNRLLNDLATISGSSFVQSRLWLASDLCQLLLMALSRAMCRYRISESILVSKMKQISTSFLSSCPDTIKGTECLSAVFEQLRFVFDAMPIKEFLLNNSLGAIQFFLEIVKCDSFVLPESIEASIMCIMSSCIDWRFRIKDHLNSLDIILTLLKGSSNDTKKSAFKLFQESILVLFLRTQDMPSRKRIIEVLLLILPHIRSADSTLVKSYCRGLEITLLSDDQKLREDSLQLIHYFVHMSPSTCLRQTTTLLQIIEAYRLFPGPPHDRLIADCFQQFFAVENFLSSAGPAISNLLEIIADRDLRNGAFVDTFAYNIVLGLIPLCEVIPNSLHSANDQSLVYRLLFFLLTRAVNASLPNCKMYLSGLKHLLEFYIPTPSYQVDFKLFLLEIWKFCSFDLAVCIEVLGILQVISRKWENSEYCSAFVTSCILPVIENVCLQTFADDNIHLNFWVAFMKFFTECQRKAQEDTRRLLFSTAESAGVFCQIIRCLQQNDWGICKDSNLFLDALVGVLSTKLPEDFDIHVKVSSLSQFRIRTILLHLKESLDLSDLVLPLLFHVIQLSKIEITREFASEITIALERLLYKYISNAYSCFYAVRLLIVVDRVSNVDKHMVGKSVDMILRHITSESDIKVFQCKEDFWQWIWCKTFKSSVQRQLLLKTCVQSPNFSLTPDIFCLKSSNVQVSEILNLEPSLSTLQLISELVIEQDHKTVAIRFASSMLGFKCPDYSQVLTIFVKWLDQNILDKSFFEEHISIIVNWIENLQISLLLARSILAVIPKSIRFCKSLDPWLKKCFGIARAGLDAEIDAEHFGKQKVISTLIECIALLSEYLRYDISTAVDLLDKGLQFANSATFSSVFVLSYNVLQFNSGLKSQPSVFVRILKLIELAAGICFSYFEAIAFLAQIGETRTALDILACNQSIEMQITASKLQATVYQNPIALQILYLMALLGKLELKCGENEIYCPIRRWLVENVCTLQYSIFEHHRCTECSQNDISLHLTIMQHIQRIRILGQTQLDSNRQESKKQKPERKS